MREIKFRALYEGKWYYQTLDEMLTTTLAAFRLGKHKTQYTGLKDKNGKEIYEGDIVKFHYFYGSVGENLGFIECEHELIGVIKWGTFGWAVEQIKGEHWQGYTGFEDGEGESSILDLCAMNESSTHEESFEIIGNIYENPELIKEVTE